MKKTVKVYWFTPKWIINSKNVTLKGLHSMLSNQYKYDIIRIDVLDKEYEITIKDDIGIGIAREYLGNNKK